MTRDTTLIVEPNKEFVETDYINQIKSRALNYIKAGFPVHFRGPAGTGKSTIAKHVAGHLNRPITLLHGDEEITSGSLVGGESGYQYKRVRDNFIASVLKEEEVMTKNWVDNKLTEACKHGYTLVYDEFTRSRPEANNVLLSVLQDRLLTVSNESYSGSPYLEVHPEFTAIFTSNPEEYAGTHKSQDALRDRMVTIDLDYPDFETEVKIAYAKARLPRDVCEYIVSIVRSLRETGECEFSPTIRAGIMIAKTLTVINMEPEDDMNLFITYCQDILSSETSRLSKKSNQDHIKTLIKEIALRNKPQNSRFMVS